MSQTNLGLICDFWILFRLGFLGIRVRMYANCQFFYFKLHRLVLTGYSITYLENQTLELILNQVQEHILAQKNANENKLLAKILLYPGRNVTSACIARAMNCTAYEVIEAMKNLDQQDLGHFCEVIIFTRNI